MGYEPKKGGPTTTPPVTPGLSTTSKPLKDAEVCKSETIDNIIRDMLYLRCSKRKKQRDKLVVELKTLNGIIGVSENNKEYKVTRGITKREAIVEVMNEEIDYLNTVIKIFELRDEA